AAQAIGAVNTIVCDGERLIGTNTDGEGLARALAEEGIALNGARVLIVGAGGAARASAYGLAQAGAASVAIAGRRPERAQAVVRDLSRAMATPMRALSLADLREEAERTDLLVQATSATLGDGDDAKAFA